MDKLQCLQEKIIEISEYKDLDSSILYDLIADATALKDSIANLAEFQDKNMKLQELNETKMTIQYLSHCLIKIINISHLFGFDINDLISVADDDINVIKFIKEYNSNKD